MLARAGESDRAIKVKMVRVLAFPSFTLSDPLLFTSPNIFSLGNGKAARPTGDDFLLVISSTYVLYCFYTLSIPVYYGRSVFSQNYICTKKCVRNTKKIRTSKSSSRRGIIAKRNALWRIVWSLYGV